MPKREIYNYFFFFFLLLVLYGIGCILTPFAGALLSALVLAIIFYPLYEWLGRRMKGRSPNFRAILIDLLVLIAVVLPVGILIWTLILESEALGEVLRIWTQALAKFRNGGLEAPWLNHLRGWMSRALGVSSSQFQENIFGRIGKALGAVTLIGAEMAQNILRFIFQGFIMLFTLFFLFRDGRQLYAKFEGLLPMNDEDTRAVSERVHDTITAVVRGWLLTSVVQGAVATIGYLIAGVPAPALFGVLTAVIGLLPVVGTFGVWIPMGAYLLISGSVWQGVFVWVWGAFVVVGLMDTALRPYLVGKGADLPILPLFFGLLGGVEVFGAKGVIVGPLLVSIAPLLLNIYRRRYMHVPSS